MNNTVEVDLTASAAGGHLKANNGASAAMNGAKQCLNVYCHSNGYSANVQYATTPAWGGSFPDDKCSNCHGNSPGVNIAGSTAHSAHVVGIHYEDIFNGISKKLPRGGGDTVNAAHGRNNRSTTINCNICHSSTVSSFFNDKNSVCKDCHGGVAPLKGNASIADTSKHVNGSVDVNFINSTIATKAQVAQAAFAAYTAAGSGGWSRNKSIYKSYTSGYDVTKVALSASPAYSAAGCAVACHGNNAVLWTDTVTCTSCHTRLK
ncbi:MAG: hypothetical protein CVU66_01810 [Deltaproteobacteria bacterium HGW-Deltaproteobacteria-23]|nr:MAG: hypothetical protein CVU66_01810 [Deltaproteobacteria bacterium HGW-Deltaproteobacteria-23]